jgi:hypothetical protein
MYSQVHGKTFERIVAVGVLPDGSELTLQKAEFLAPLDESRLSSGVLRALELPGAAERMKDVAERLATRYETLRLSRRHAGPELAALRLYRMTWSLESETPERTPLARELLVEAAGGRGM